MNYVEILVKTKDRERFYRRIVKDIFAGKLKRFLKNHEKQYWYEKTYSRLIPRLMKNPKSKRGVEWLLKQDLMPNRNRDILNVAVTLEKYYNTPISRLNLFKAYVILVEAEEDIEQHMKDIWVETCYSDLRQMRPRQAIKEQKARGFVMLDDFEEYDSSLAHVKSSINPKLIWPENFRHGIGKKELKEIYSVFHKIGVAGFTSCSLPKYN